MQYAEEPDIAPQLNGRESMAFDFIAFDIDQAKMNYENLCQTQSKNGSKGGRPKKASSDEKSDGFLENPKNPMLFSETQKSKTNTNTKTENKTETETETKGEKAPLSPLTPEFGTDLASAVEAWLTYKHEKRQDYTPTGQEALIAEIRKNAEIYGETAVAELVRQCMASNWQGIIFDRLKKETKPASSPKQAPTGATGAAGQHELDAVKRLQRIKQQKEETHE